MPITFQTGVARFRDANGNEVDFNALGMGGGSGDGSGEKWELIQSGTITNSIAKLTINKDQDGNPFRLKKARWKARIEKIGGITFRAQSPSVNGYGKGAFFNTDINANANATDYYLNPVQSVSGTMTPYGGGGYTADLTNQPFELNQDYLWYLDDSQKMHVEVYVELYTTTTEGIKFPVTKGSGGVNTFRKSTLKQREFVDGSAIVFDSIEEIEWIYEYSSGSGITYELWGVRA